MSYWVYVMDPHGEPVVVERHREGGTYAMFGTDEACMNVTYNYDGPICREGVFDGASLKAALDGKRAGDLIPALERAVAHLGTDRDPDYWKPSNGNAGAMLDVLLEWARQHPDGTFKVD